MTILSLLNPFGWFGGYQAKLSGGQSTGQSSAGWNHGSDAGEPVTPETALAMVTYWACVKLIGQTIGTLPLHIYALADDGSRTLAVDHPMYDLLHDQPNADHTAVEFWEGVGACLAVWGNAYVLKQSIGPRVVALDLLRPFWMNVFRDGNGTVYRYNDPARGQRDYTTAEVMHVRGFGFGDVLGLSPISFLRNSIGTAIATDRAAGSVFRNGLRLSGWIRAIGTANNGILTKDQQEQIREALIKPLTGSANAGKVGLLPGNLEWVTANMSPVDAELLSNRRLNVEEICRGFGIPPIMVGHAGQGQTMFGSGVDQLMLAFMTLGLRPYLHRIEAAIGRDLIGRADRRKYAVAFDTEEILRGDNKGRALIDSQMANTGIMTRNEIRAVRNLPPKAGGDTLTVQAALLPIEMLGEIAKLPRDKPVVPGADTDPLSAALAADDPSNPSQTEAA